MQKYFFFIQILLLTISQGQNIEIFVFDSKSLIPLKNANILLINSNEEFGGYTNDEGKYFFTNIRTGDYELLVSFRVEDDEYGLYIPLDPFFIVAELKNDQAILVEGEEFDKIQPLIESELEDRELTD